MGCSQLAVCGLYANIHHALECSLNHPVCTSCVHLLKFIIPNAVAMLVVSLVLMSKRWKIGKEGRGQVHRSQHCSGVSGLIVSVHMLASRVQSTSCKRDKQSDVKDNDGEVIVTLGKAVKSTLYHLLFTLS